MKTFGLASFAATLFIAFAAQGGDDAALKKERAALQGMWKVVAFEDADGKKDDLVGATLDFAKDGKMLTFTRGGETKKGTFKLNVAGKPKEIDITADDNSMHWSMCPVFAASARYPSRWLLREPWPAWAASRPRPMASTSPM